MDVSLHEVNILIFSCVFNILALALDFLKACVIHFPLIDVTIEGDSVRNRCSFKGLVLIKRIKIYVIKFSPYLQTLLAIASICTLAMSKTEFNVE